MTLAAAIDSLRCWPAKAHGSPTQQRPSCHSARGNGRPVILVAQGRTDDQFAGQLFISVRTVRTHLDRIRDKTGCRRRADLTRPALSAGPG